MERKEKGAKVSEKNDKQARAFRKAAREAGVEPNADIDEVMRRLAGQKKEKQRPMQLKKKPKAGR